MILKIKNSAKKFCNKGEAAQVIYLRYAILISD